MNNRKNKFIFALFLFSLLGTMLSAQEIKDNVLYKIVSPSGLVLDNRLNTDNSSNVYLAADAKESKGQYWRLIRYKDLYVIYNPFVNKSFDIGTSRAIEEPIGVWDVSRANGNQQWVLTPKGKDRYEIKHNNAQLLLSFKPADKADPRSIHCRLRKQDGVWRLKPTSEKLPPENVHGKAEWENEQIFAINKEEGHNTFVPFSSVEKFEEIRIFQSAMGDSCIGSVLFPERNLEVPLGETAVGTSGQSTIRRITMCLHGKKFPFLPIWRCRDTEHRFTPMSLILSRTILQ